MSLERANSSRQEVQERCQPGGVENSTSGRYLVNAVMAVQFAAASNVTHHSEYAIVVRRASSD
jgi:hypothetical protein